MTVVPEVARKIWRCCPNAGKSFQMLLGEIVTLRLQRTLFCYLRGCSLREITKQLTDERTVRVDVACLRHAFKDPRAKRYIREIVSFAGVDVKRLEELTGWHGWRRREDENMAGG